MNTLPAYHRGYTREDGKMFWQYSKLRQKDGTFKWKCVWTEPEKFYARREKTLKREAERYQKNKKRLTEIRNIPENRERKRKYAREYRKRNIDVIKIRKTKWAQSPNGKKSKKRYGEKYRQRPETKRKMYEYVKHRMQTDPQFALMKRTGARIRDALKKRCIKKTQKTKDLIGCSVEFLREHIEKQFRDGMAWDKPNSFHIDHIRPVSSFNLLDPEQLKQAFHWTNLQPLTPEENMKKGAIFRLQD